MIPKSITSEGDMVYLCETCEARGELVVAWTPATRTAPTEPVWEECEVCLGRGEVKAWELERWDGVFPLAEEVVEELWRRRIR